MINQVQVQTQSVQLMHHCGGQELKSLLAFSWPQSFAFTRSCVCRTLRFSNVTRGQNLVPGG